MNKFKQWWVTYKRKRELNAYIKRLWGYMDISNSVERRAFMEEILRSQRELNRLNRGDKP